MKHIFYKPKESAYQTIVIYPIKDDSHPKDITIFHNTIASHTWVLTLDEFTNSFNDASELDYLEPEYKERVVKAYWQNQKEYPNEDLMYFDGNFSHLDKILISKYSKNEKMLERILMDRNSAIRVGLIGRTDLPEYIANKLILDPARYIRLSMAVDHPLSKEQVKLYAKESEDVVAYELIGKYWRILDDEMVEYFVKNGSNAIKENISNLWLTKTKLTNEQVEFLANPKNSSFRTQVNLISFYKLSESAVISILNFWRSHRLIERELLNSLAVSGYMTNTIVDKILEFNDHSFKLKLILNTQLHNFAPTVYQYAVSQILKSDDIGFLTRALNYYVRNQEITSLNLPIELLEHLIKINNKKGNLEFGDSILRIQGIPQHFAERIIFDSLTNYKVVNSKEKDKWYYTFGKSTQYSSMIKQAMDYASGLKFIPPSLSSIFEFRLKV